MKIPVSGAIALFLLIGISATNGQPVPPASINGALAQRFPLPTYTPPLRSDMPYNVMIGYVIGDSAARNIYLAQQDNLFRNLTYSDTLRYALKYLYEMVDYDPVRFYQWGSYLPAGNWYPSPPAVLRNRLVESATNVYPDKQRTAMLSAADVIAHITVNSTESKIDTMPVFARSAVAVTASVVEPIKGKRIPNCWIPPSVNVNTKGARLRSLAGVLISAMGDRAAEPGACLQFEYRLEWPRLNHTMMQTNLDSTLVDGSGKQWVQPNTEYIVFLRFLGLARDGQYDYAALIPVAWFGTTCSMYPIINGMVYDPYDDFGFGTGLTPEQFKAALRDKIDSITNP